ncbi:hypothetical protein BDN67DRAFT_975274, partial [Paxillus ammoniavirescens]
ESVSTTVTTSLSLLEPPSATATTKRNRDHDSRWPLANEQTREYVDELPAKLGYISNFKMWSERRVDIAINPKGKIQSTLVLHSLRRLDGKWTTDL